MTSLTMVSWLRIIIKKGSEKRLWFGHHWIFSNELESIPKAGSGEIVEVISSSGKLYGKAFYNPHSLISARLLFTNDEINTAFYIGRIKTALTVRTKLFPDSNVYRLIFGESDFIPGLIVDRYGDYLSLQALSAGIEKHIPLIVDALLDVLPDTKGVYEKNNSSLRALEGLELREGVLHGSVPDNFVITEENIRLSVSLSEGQKTGYFLDQRLNRKFIRSISEGLDVLDCYTNQGGFALNACAGGAKEVTAVDISKPALDRAEENSKLNNFNIEFVKADVPEYLAKSIQDGRKWDLIILDPPAFTKSRKKIPLARAGYAKINRLAMQLIKNNGYLVASSCTYQIDETAFLDIIHKEAAKLGKQLRIIFRGMQSPCHPVIISMPETKYLKFFVFELRDTNHL